MAHPLIRNYERVKRSLWSRIKNDFFRKYDLKKNKKALICNGFAYMSLACYEKMMAENHKIDKMLKDAERNKRRA